MEKVFQRVVDSKVGDCMQACIATLFGKTYEETPSFVFQPEDWIELLKKYAVENGYKYKGMLYNRVGAVEAMHLKNLPSYVGVNGLFYGTVYSPKYYSYKHFNEITAPTHAVLVDRDFNIVHDPNPENKKVEQYPLAKEVGYNGILRVILIEPA